ncbi:hypothetical protein [Dietzia sp. 179-F 9C3 NHS]|uniref:hypothetical protein n=1 Tax=Dietzia sp. 179-F 9C3 NHS TaxID=3374295 RepID=UPI00387974A7
MAVTVRLTDQRAHELATIMERCERTAVWTATQALLAAAHAHTSHPRPLAGYLGRQPSTCRVLIALRGDVLDIVDGLVAAHTHEGQDPPSRHVIVRAALAYLVDTHGSAAAAAEHLGGYGAGELQGRGVA